MKSMFFLAMCRFSCCAKIAIIFTILSEKILIFPYDISLQGTDTPFLKLYNLQSGTYRFKLKVIDASGQQSVDTAVVTVSKGNENKNMVHYDQMVEIWKSDYFCG